MVFTLQLERPLIKSFYFGWFFSIVSIVASYYFDLPTGYTIVFLGAFMSLIIVFFAKEEVSK